MKNYGKLFTEEKRDAMKFFMDTAVSLIKIHEFCDAKANDSGGALMYDASKPWASRRDKAEERLADVIDFLDKI